MTVRRVDRVGVARSPVPAGAMAGASRRVAGRCGRWLAMALVLGAGAPAFGQAVNPLPPSALPTREELQAGAPPVEPAAAPRRQHRLHVEGEVERSPCALDNPQFAGIHVRLTAASFANLGPVPAAALDDSWRQYVGTDQPISVVCRIRDAAATALRAMGYIAAVEVPVQRIEGGAVRFEVLYAKVTSVRVIGRPGRDAGQLQVFLDQLLTGRVFNRFEAERSVLLAQDIPGYDIHLTLKPSGTGAGNMVAEVRVDDTPVIVDFNASDLAAPSTGRIGGQLRATFNGLTGLGDQTTLSAYTTGEFREQQIYQIGHQFLLGGSGLQLAAHVTYAVTRPNLGPGGPNIDAHTLYVNGEARYPLVRSQAFSLHGALGLDVVNQNVDFDGQPLSRDHLRIGYLRFDFEAMDMKGLGPDVSTLWRITGSAEIRKGLAIFSASPDCATVSCAGIVPPGVNVGDPQATVFRASAAIDLHPLRWLDFALAPRVQLASAPLLGFEQFTLGNYTIGRGFDPGAVVGDNGVAFAFEARSPFRRFSPTSVLAWQPYVFSDNGWAWQLDALQRAGIGSPLANPQQLHSLGGGVRLAFENDARLDLSMAAPITRLAGETRTRPALFLATLSAVLFPWRYH
ncbi:MAG: ShlB/FhaC/HecB family hemolysin secretion/activation protein [Sphingomonadales bacterium]|nr:ShlB/FhaC/HecB family hemolysin secretion/activation protein [Sphingomonadales bacterium]